MSLNSMHLNSMTRRHPSLSCLALALSATMILSACGGGEHAAEEGHAQEQAQYVTASSGLPEGRIAEGKVVANAKSAATGQACVDCHGVDGNAPIAPIYPKIGGQYASYLAHSLQAYRSGERSNALMSIQAKELSNQQIADVAAWFASRPSQLTDLQGTHD